MAAGLYGIRTSARLGTVLGIFEVAVFLILGVMLVVHAGVATRCRCSAPDTPPTAAESARSSPGSVFTILAFGGFEGALPLAEEAKDPRRTIRKAGARERPCSSVSCTSSPPTR